MTVLFEHLEHDKVNIFTRISNIYVFLKWSVGVLQTENPVTKLYVCTYFKFLLIILTMRWCDGDTHSCSEVAATQKGCHHHPLTGKFSVKLHRKIKLVTLDGSQKRSQLFK